MEISFYISVPTINNNHMMYGSWDMKFNRQNFLFWAIFCPFTPLTTRKIKILKKWKNQLDISSFYTNALKIMIICYNVPETWCKIYIFHFGLFSPFYPITAQKTKLKKKKKKQTGGIIILHMCTKNYDHIMYASWDMVHNRWMDRQMNRWTDGLRDGQKKWLIEVGVPPKKITLQKEIRLWGLQRIWGLTNWWLKGKNL